MESDDVSRLLDMQGRMLDLLERAIAAQSPVEVIRALNPPIAPPIEQPQVDPLAGDMGRREDTVDSWGDVGVTLEDIRMSQVGTNGYEADDD